MFFETHDGTRIAYEDYGTGEPVVLIAGAMLNTDMWECQIPFLVEHGYRCIAIDRRGHGRSDRPSDGYDIETTTEDLAALLEHLDLRDATLVGHSTGGAEAARYLARHGNARVARVVFLAAILPFLKLTEDNPGGIPEEVAEQLFQQIRADRGKWMARQTQAYFATHLGNDVSPQQIDATYQQCMSTSPWATLKMQQAAFHADSREALSRVTVPAMVVHGAADFSAPIDVTGRSTAAALPGCTYREYPTAGHGLYVSHAAELNADLLAFLKS
ncbi:alpha/beta fold hydrolase [Kitasatospora viridis]|uniref:Pimeloyl-ACP methyl ester carboxylesterase n=1 Tax=Kitasatospora viridis TaxID=281105 RepID=A0A561UD72_9ACTN|nr:alpha/beta hydrolase [Kitasatospora viridis]TWF97296.1 pimeloyl-ACP methyl ester carboxylesterase [Kitasatospora viridis]